MTKDELLDSLKRTLLKTDQYRITDLCFGEPQTMHLLLDLTFFKQPEIAFRAAWILELSQKKYPQQFQALVPRFLDCYPKQPNHSCQRHYTKMLMNLLDKKAIDKDYDYQQIIEATFVWMADEAVPVAVKANCMTILFVLREKEDWIEEELKAQIEFLMRDGTGAIQSRGKKILTMLSSK